jgi:hypothetical protein
MNVWQAALNVSRILRWALWIAFVVFSGYYVFDPAPHLTQFGHLTYTTEAFMFGLPLGAVTAGFMELLFRERMTGVRTDLKR